MDPEDTIPCPPPTEPSYFQDFDEWPPDLEELHHDALDDGFDEEA